MTNELAKLDKATQMLAEAKTLDDVAKITSIAEAAKAYAKAAKLGLEAYNHAAEVKVRAERKAGEMLRKLERSKGGQPTHSTMERVETSDYRAVLEDQSIAPVTAHRWQQLADMPEKTFEQTVKDLHGERPISTSAVIQAVKTADKEKIRDDLRRTGAELEKSTARYVLRCGDIRDGLSEINDQSVAIIYQDRQTGKIFADWIDRLTWNGPFAPSPKSTSGDPYYRISGGRNISDWVASAKDEAARIAA